jgi:hypothetical protein
MSCPPGQLCINNTHISIFAVIAVISAYALYNLQGNKLNNDANNRQRHLQDNEMLKRNLNIKIDVPEQTYRVDPDYNNKFTKRVTHPLYPPEKSYGQVVSTPDLHERGVPGLPINIKTRGYGGDYQQMGVLYSGETRLPLYGRQTYQGSNQWNYYTSTDSNQSIKLPINKSNAKCTDERGCPEISNGESVSVSTYDGTDFKAEIYSNDGPRYIPYV